jgi:hypothetical protein
VIVTPSALACMSPALAAELRAMVEEDQRIRRRPPEQEKKFVVLTSPEEPMEWNRVGARNTDRLKEIVERSAGLVTRWSERKPPSTHGCWPSTPITSLFSSVEYSLWWPRPESTAKPRRDSSPT